MKSDARPPRGLYGGIPPRKLKNSDAFFSRANDKELT